MKDLNYDFGALRQDSAQHSEQSVKDCILIVHRMIRFREHSSSVVIEFVFRFSGIILHGFSYLKEINWKKKPHSIENGYHNRFKSNVIFHLSSSVVLFTFHFIRAIIVTHKSSAKCEVHISSKFIHNFHLNKVHDKGEVDAHFRCYCKVEPLRSADSYHFNHTALSNCLHYNITLFFNCIFLLHQIFIMPQLN